MADGSILYLSGLVSMSGTGELMLLMKSKSKGKNLKIKRTKRDGRNTTPNRGGGYDMEYTENTARLMEAVIRVV